MKDQEFVELRNKFFLGLFISIVFIIPIFFFLKNKFYISNSDIYNSIDNKNDMLILVVENKCNKCNESKKVLSNTDINYYILNKDKQKDYNDIIRKLNLHKKEIITPTLIYIKEGNTYAYINNIKSEKEINEFIENNILNKGE